jgi:DNA mismatch repair ATPase MutS
MCGFPLSHINRHLKTLVQKHNRFVAMCEEFPRAATLDEQAGFDRRVVRVITPGTLIDEPFLNQYENNYLLAVGMSADSQGSDSLGLAWIDVSTGEFFAKTSTYDGFRDELARIGPREVVLDKWLEQATSHPVCQALNEEGNLVSYIGMADTELPTLGAETTDDITTKPTPLSTSSFTDVEASAIKLLTTFLHAHLLEHMPQLGLPHREGSDGRMQIDAHTIRALEIRERMGEGAVTGSLLSVIKRTLTNGGTRLLSRWLCK